MAAHGASDRPVNAFETARLSFRAFEPEDLDELARISGDSETSRYVGEGQPLTRAQTREWIENSRRNVAEHGYGTGAVVLRSTGALIGWAGIARPGDGTEEIIYGFDRPHWGQGLGGELLAGLVQWAVGRLGFRELRATVHPDNTASVAMLERQGFNLVEAAFDGDPEVHLYILTLSP
ncbi:MAG: GNAT family N-acetyltransferase [Pseudomonadales bacterium]|jgi:RimJ/RimL family protein N-acetyltransferase